MPTRTKNAERVAEHRERVKERNKLIEKILMEIIEDGDIKYTLAPVAPYPEKDPLKNGIKFTYVMSEQTRDTIIAHALKEPALNFDELLKCLDIRLMRFLLDIGFVQHDYRLKEGTDGS